MVDVKKSAPPNDKLKILDTETGHAIKDDNDNDTKDGSSDATNDDATDNDDGTSLKEQTTQTLDTGWLMACDGGVMLLIRYWQW